MIEQVSFVVIARNEEFAVAKCLHSILSMPLKNCEVITIDSNSTDNTLAIMESYIGRIANLRIIQISGYMNAAVARNAGMQYVTKPYIFFVDGDVELFPEFISQALGRIQTGCAAAVTGVLNELIYYDDYKNIMAPLSPRHYYHKEMAISHTGGIFLTTKHIVEMVGTWDERMDINEDIDYTLRINRYGTFIALPNTMGTHHTLSYNARPWEHFQKRYPMYFGMLIRKNSNQPKNLLLLLKANRGYSAGFVVYLLLVLGIMATITLKGSFYYVFFIILLLVITDLCWGAIRKKNIINHFLVHYLHVPLIIAGILFDTNTKRPATVKKNIY